MGQILVRPLRRADYLPTLQAMREFTAARDADTGDEIWMIEHPPVFTLGQAGRAEHLLDTGGVDVVRMYREDSARSDILAVDWSEAIRVTSSVCARMVTGS